MSTKNTAPVDPHRIFKNALCFERAALAIREFNYEELKMPWGVNVAFCIELYLKCLITIEKGTKVGGHDLESLFSNLTKQTRETLIKEWDSFVTTSVEKQKMRSDGYSTDLPSELKRSKNAFQWLRYEHEDLSKTGSGLTIGPLMIMLRDVIISMHPEWIA